MILEPTTITCKTGKEFKLVPIGPEYAEEYLEFMHQVSSDTHFMSRYGDEVKLKCFKDAKPLLDKEWYEQHK